MTSGTTTIFTRAFGALEPRTLATLHQVAVRQSYPPDTTLCRQGNVEHTFYVVMEGSVAVNQVLENGQKRVLNIIGPSGYFGEMGLIDEEPRLANCVTLTDVTVLEMTAAAFAQFISESPILAYAVLRKILATARSMDQQFIQDLREKNVALERAVADLQQAQAEILEKERLEHELELAVEVQRSLLPADFPTFPDYAFAAYLEPARQVGGDFYDVIVIDEENVGFLIADVADKGFHSALFMAVIRTLFSQAARQSLSPAAVATAVHKGMFTASSLDTFVTAFYAILHRPSGRLTYVRAAHDRPLWFRPTRGVESLSGNGRFLGMIEDLELAEHSLTLQPGDRLIMFSDGVPDAPNRLDEPFGLDRLTAVVEKSGEQPAAALVEQITQELSRWRGQAEQFDDITLLVLEVKS